MAERPGVLDGQLEVDPDAEDIEDEIDEALHASSEWSRAVAEAASRAGMGLAISLLVDGENRLAYVNEGACAILGRTRDELVGGPPVPDLDPEEEDTLRNREAGSPRFLETEVVRPDGTEVPVEVGLSTGTYWGRHATFAFLRDVTDRREAERALADREERLESIWANTTVGLYRTTPEGEILDVNPALAEMLGYDDPDVLRDHDVEEAFYTGERSRKRWRQEVESAGDVRDLEGTYRRRDGGVVHVRESVHMVRDGDDVQWYEGTMEDVTALVQAQDRLEEVNEDLRHTVSLHEATLDAVADGVLVVDRDGNIVDCNDRYVEMWKLPERIVESGDDEEAITYVLDQLEDPEAFQERIEALYANPEEESFDVLEFEDGRIFERHSRPQHLGGETVGRVWSFRDVTDERRTKRELERSNEELQRFAHIISHDLREPLRTVTSFLELLEDRIGDDLDEDEREFIDYARDGADRMKTMIDGILEYSRVETTGGDLEPIDLGAAVDHALDNLRVRIDETGAEIIAEDLPRVQADPVQLGQLLQNLIDNALKYRARDRPPHIEITAERTGSTWTVHVADDGQGMDDTTRERAFDIFQRGPKDTEGPDGEGVGLAVCQRIVERHGGEIRIEATAPDEGTTVAFTLSATSDDTDQAGG